MGAEYARLNRFFDKVLSVSMAQLDFRDSAADIAALEAGNASSDAVVLDLENDSDVDYENLSLPASTAVELPADPRIASATKPTIELREILQDFDLLVNALIDANAIKRNGDKFDVLDMSKAPQVVLTNGSSTPLSGSETSSGIVFDVVQTIKHLLRFDNPGDAIFAYSDLTENPSELVEAINHSLDTNGKIKNPDNLPRVVVPGRVIQIGGDGNGRVNIGNSFQTIWREANQGQATGVYSMEAYLRDPSVIEEHLVTLPDGSKGIDLDNPPLLIDKYGNVERLVGYENFTHGDKRYGRYNPANSQRHLTARILDKDVRLVLHRDEVFADSSRLQEAYDLAKELNGGTYNKRDVAVITPSASGGYELVGINGPESGDKINHLATNRELYKRQFPDATVMSVPEAIKAFAEGNYQIFDDPQFRFIYPDGSFGNFSGDSFSARGEEGQLRAMLSVLINYVKHGGTRDDAGSYSEEAYVSMVKDIMDKVPEAAGLIYGAYNGPFTDGRWFKSGLFTGPDGKIGSNINGQWHIDTKIMILGSLDSKENWDRAIQLFDSMAAGYAAQQPPRVIEFSNKDAHVNGQRRYTLDMSREEKLALLKAAEKAHRTGGRPHNGKMSFDYYVPTASSSNLNAPDAKIEDVEMILPVIPGGSARYHNWGGENDPRNYGMAIELYDKNGAKVLQTGHGNVDKGKPENFFFDDVMPEDLQSVEKPYGGVFQGLRGLVDTAHRGVIGAFDDLFKGDSDSLAAVAIGSAEGTRTPDGAKTPAYNGHTDPGNFAHNLGTFSYQHGALSPEAADKAQIGVLKKQGTRLRQQAAARGFTMTLAEELNGLDLANQAPTAALESYIDWLVVGKNKGLSGRELIIFARTKSFIDPDTGYWDAPGLGNNEASIKRDQSRRHDAVDSVIKKRTPGLNLLP